jgi:hypothetical protein
VFDTGGTTPLAGDAFLIELLAGSNLDALERIGEPVPSLTGHHAGYFDGGIREIASVPPGGAAVLQLCAGESRCGDSFETALTEGCHWGVCWGFPFRLVSSAELLPRIESPIPGDGVRFGVFLRGIPGREILVQRSVDLEKWEDWLTLTATGAPRELVDDETSSRPWAFYRAAVR